MRKYEVTITEILKKTIEAIAEDYDDAIEQVKDKYYNADIVLGYDDHWDVDFELENKEGDDCDE